MKNTLRTTFRLFVVAVVVLTFSQANAQLLQWNTFGNAGTETTEPSVANDANIAAANLTLGAGVIPTAALDRFGGNNWFDTGDSNPTTLAQSVSGNDYIQFVVTPNTGYSFTPTSLVFGWDRSSTGPANVTLRSSADGFTADLGSVTGMAAAQSNGNTITISGLSNISVATTFRLYGWNATNTGGTGGFDVASNVVNVVLNGTTTLSYDKVSTGNGDWATAGTWTPSGAPTAGQTVLIQTGHTVFTSATVTRSTTTTVNGNFQLNTGGYATGTAFTYGSAGGLYFNTTGNYSVANTDVFWPATSGPFNLSLLQGGITLNSTSRSVNGTFNVGGTLGITFNGGSTLTMNGFCSINAGGFFANSGVIYGASSTLTYLTFGAYGRGFEWNALGVGTIGVTQGYPNNVTVGGLTTLNYNNGGTPLAKAMAGNLTLGAGAAFNMNDGGGASGGALTVAGNVNIGPSASMTLGNTSGDDLKIGGDFTNSNVFNGNSRAIWFIKTSGTQTVTNTSSTQLTIPYIVFNATGSRTVALSGVNLLTVSAPLGGNAISFGSAADILSVGSSQTLTIGTAAVANTILGAGTFTFGSLSNLSLLGTGNIGTINLTGGAQTINNFTINRTAGTAACTIGGNLTVSTALNLTNGLVNIGNNFISIGSATTITPAGGSAAGFVIADLVNGTSAAFRRGFTGAGSFVYPIGDNSGNFTPVTATFPAGGTFSSAYCSAAVRAIKHPQLDAPTDFITRYWQILTSGISYAGFTTFSATGNYVNTDINGTEANMIGNTWTSGWATGAAVNAAANTFVAACVPGATNQITAGYRGADIAITNPVPSNQANGTTYAFGAQAVGSNTDITFTISNFGQQSLTFGGMPVVTSSTAGVYTLLPGFVTTPLAVGATRTFTIRFTPAAITTYNTGNFITFNTNDPDENPYVINFTGSGVAAVKDINIKGLGQTINPGNTPSFLDDSKYVATAVGSPLAHTFTIENIGNITLNVSGVSIGGTNPGDFAVTTAPASTVAGGSTTTFVVTFTPTAAGVRSATVTVTSDDPDEATYTFNVEGTGNDREIEVYGYGYSIVSGDATPSTADGTDYGTVNVTSGSTIKYYSIFNTGTLTLTISSYTITGANSGDFSVIAFPTSSIAANTSTTLGISFNPSATGLRTALVTINNNDSNEGTYTFVIQGNGVDYIPCALGANEIIAIQDFEVAPATPTMTYTVTPGPLSAAYSVAGGTAYGASRVTPSNKFIGARSFQLPGHSATSTTEQTTTVDFSTVNASAYQDVGFSLRIGGYSTNTVQGLDGNPEKCIVYISKDGGATWSQEFDIAGNSNAIWDINSSASTVTLNYDGNNITTNGAASANSTNTTMRSLTLNNLPNSAQLKVRITLTLDRADELWVIDDVQFFGKRTATTTWQSPGAWSNGVPTSSTKAVIAFPYNTTTGSIDACACQINAGGSITVNANQYVDVQDNFDNAGTFTVDSSGSLIQHNNTAVNSGSVDVKRTTAPYRKFDYTYWSSPITNANVAATFTGWRTDYAFQFATANYQDLTTAATGLAPADGYDDDGNSWLNISPASTMTPGKGYAIMAPTNVTFSPTAIATVTFSGPVNNGIITAPLAQSQNAADNTDDFNLIGNPYPSALSADTFITENAVNSTQITGTLYFWTHATPIAPIPGPSQYNFISADYAMYTLAGGTASATGSAQPTGKIASGEGFFVDAANSGTLATFNNSMRDKTYNNSQFFRTTSIASEQPTGEKDRIWLNFTHDNGLFSQQLLAYFPNTTLGYDTAYDGIVNLTQNSVSFYSFIEADHYRIQARPSFDTSDIVPLGYNVLAPGTYHIAIAQTEGVLTDDNTHVYLEDRLLNIIHNLKESAYDFTTEAGTYNERFQLRYTDAALGNPDFEANENAVAVAVSNNQINVKSYNQNIGSIAVYDILGRLVYDNKNVGKEQFSINSVVKNQQALIVKVTLENGATVNKKIVF